MTTVQVRDKPTKIQYPIGSTPDDGPFLFEFTYYNPVDVKIYNGDNLVNPNDYTLTGTPGTDGGYEGGSVTLDTAVTNTTITVIGDYVVERTSNFPNGSEFKIPSLNTQFNKVFSILQQFRDKMGRTLSLKDTSVLDIIEFIEDPEDGYIPIYSDVDGGFINGPDAADIANAQGYASAAQTSANNAATSASTAQSWATAAQSAATGINWTKARAASTANVNISSPGATIDSVTLVSGDRVLLKNQSTASQNGIYIWNGAAVPMTRAADMDTWAEVVSKVVQIEEGAANADIPYMTAVNSGGTLGSTSIPFIVFQPPLQDGAVSTAAKIINGILTFAHFLSSEIAATTDIIAGTANKIASASAIAPLYQGISLFQATPTAMPSGSWTTILYDQEQYKDVASWHDNATNPDRITLNFNGRISVNASVKSSNANGEYGIRILKNGTVMREITFDTGGSSIAKTPLIIDEIPVSSGDYIQIQSRQTSGISINTGTGLEATKCQIRRIR